MRKGLKGALACAALALLSAAVPGMAQPQRPRTWVDPLTGHRVVRISTEANTTSLYFTQNAFTPEGDRMVLKTPQGIAVLTLANWSIHLLVPGPQLNVLFTAHKSREAFYASRGRDDAGGPFQVFAVNIDTGHVRKVADIPGGWIGSINADDTLLLGQYALPPARLNPDGTLHEPGQGNTAVPGGNLYAERRPDGTPYTYAEAKERALHRRVVARLPMEIFTYDLRTGRRRVVVAARDWLNHVQFSPKDPGLILYCHEGPWQEVDRIWTIRTDGTGQQLVQARTMQGEIAGHEFFSPDGHTIWYDLQTPQGGVLWLAGYDVATGRRRWYALDRNQASVHYNQAPDLARFSGDGSDADMVAHAADAKYLYLFTPRPFPQVVKGAQDDPPGLITPGYLASEKLVDMRGEDYRLEPNMIFTPDGKWIIFRGNFEGSTQVYAVELARASR